MGTSFEGAHLESDDYKGIQKNVRELRKYNDNMNHTDKILVENETSE